MKIPPWSYSALECFDTCPKRYYHRYILKEKEPENESNKHGTEVHKALEERVKDKKPLPKPYYMYEKFAKSVEKAGQGGVVMVEYPLAITKDFRPCDFFGADVWGRGKADVVVHKGSKMWIGDWKTGKVREKLFQIQVFAGFLFKLFPEVEEIHGNNIWLQAGKIGDAYSFTREKGEPIIWQDILYKISRIELAARKDSFDPKPSGICGFCYVKTCPHNRG